MQPQNEQPQNHPAEQPASPQYSAAPTPVVNPVVTLSPDDAQDFNTTAPASAPVNPTESSATRSDRPDSEPVRWRATEYIHRERDQAWFVVFVIATVILIAVAIFVIKSITFAILVPVMAAALAVYVHHPPQEIDYTLSRHGLHINDRLYPFSEFKGFAVVQYGKEYSILLVPTKRFKPGVSVYFPEEAGEPIVDMLAARLPMRQIEPDLVDRLIQKLHL